MDPNKLALGLAWYVAFLFSTVVHEAAHALVARAGGDHTADSQVTLDPLPHIQREPFGMVAVPWMMFLLSPGGGMMGWASTPYDPVWAERYPRRAAWMALAGPVANLLLAVVSGAALYLGIRQQWFSGGQSADVAGTLLLVFYQLNVILFVLNLMPFPPLDGAAAITLLLPEPQALAWRQTLRNPSFSMLTLLAVWMLFPRIAEPVLRLAIDLVRA